MSEIRMAPWRESLLTFLFLTSACINYDYLHAMPVHSVLAVIGHNALLPGMVAVATYLFVLAKRA